MPWGLLTDRSKSRRWPFWIGLIILLGATLILWFTKTIAGQIVGRLLQGFASTVVWTTGLAILVDTVGAERIGQFMGYIGIALNAGSLVAPFLGGIIFAKLGYHAVFGFIVGIIALDILLRLVMIEKGQPGKYVDAEELAGVPEQAQSKSNTQKSPTISVQDVTGEAKSELQSPKPEMKTHPSHPIIRLIRSWRFVAALWGFMILAGVFSGFQATLPLFVHKTFGWDAVGGGLIFIPLSFPALFGPIIGSYTDRRPGTGRWFTLAGFLLLAVSLVLLRLVEHNSMAQKVLLCVLLICVGSCMPLTLEPLFAEITKGATRLDKEDKEGGYESRSGHYGAAYAWFNIAWCLGNSIGPLAAGMIMEKSGWKLMTMVLALVGAVSALPAGLWCEGWYWAKVEEHSSGPARVDSGPIESNL